jgi:hypothetical protein
VNSLRIQALFVRHLEQGQQQVATHFSSAGWTGHAKSIAATRNIYLEAAFYLSQVFVELAAQIGQTAIVSGLEDYVSRYLYGIQSTFKTSAMDTAWEASGGILSGDSAVFSQPPAQ